MTVADFRIRKVFETCSIVSRFLKNFFKPFLSRGQSGSPVKPCVGIWTNPINLQNQLNHPKGVCFYINKFLRND